MEAMAGKAPGEEEKKPGAKDSIDSIAGLKLAHDLDVIVEHEKGSVRRGVGWEAKLAADYGYIRRTNGVDGDEVDCFIGSNPKSEKVWVIEQRHIDGPLKGTADEFKVMLGFDDMAAALRAYTDSYSDDLGLERIKEVVSMNPTGLKQWLQVSGQNRLAH